ncbi:serine carboxypeptidase-like 17 isoform X5 [Olea europaea var. sylvestris]|uniref:serine carboxypeptidase-like 17 isoform X5 n=1 Tax=Olea europaea var. sylvestris TaxID=158386 RepID=UPI000C1CF81F|nr:serine carboxypeptidase-like 17 isoform X5 [Olea europaea var. sylvestris]
MNSTGLYGLLLLLLFNNGASQVIIKTLPGYSGNLPFKLETGYIGVGENEEVQLFYYFIESESNPNMDPLLLWMSGGPGCSGLVGFFYDIGPCTFDVENFDGSLPSIILNPYSWTKVANIIFIDAPVGTGFSYANTSQGYSSSDIKSAKDIFTFLRKWLLNHPVFIKNRLYVAGESYGGKLVPMVAMEILQGNETGLQPQMSFQGYIIGNGLTDSNIDFNARIPYVHRMALISDEYFESAKINCDGKYYNRDPNNLQCTYALQRIQKCLSHINQVQILDPKCGNRAPKPYDFGWDLTFSNDNSIDHLVLPTADQECHNQDYSASDVWANNQIVQKALYIRKGMITRWRTCSDRISYNQNVESALEYHKILIKKGYHVLVFNGDHDMAAPYMGPLKWIHILNLTIDDDWRPWLVNGQVAGYTEKYKKNDFDLTFVTVKGAGHTASSYKPKECLTMLHRWLSRRPL